MRKFLTSVAMLALAASAAQADPGGGKGGGDKAQGGGKAHAGHAQVAQGGGNPEKGGGKDRAERGDGMNDRGGGKPDRAEARGNSGKAEVRAERDRGPDRSVDNRGNRGDDDRQRGRDRSSDDRDVRVVRERDRDVVVVRDDRDPFDRDDVRRTGLIDGCPPGLAKKNNGCMPPGLARQRDEGRDWMDRADWWDIDGLSDGRYRYMDGSLVRFDGDRIGSWLPLLGGALSPGNLWPSFYQPTPVPAYYQDYFGLGPANGYRYADDVLYRVDPETLAISSIAALLTGDDISIGQPLPSSYDVYNVPFSYRDRYADGPDALYRYSDGYVYEVDPKTRLVAAAIELLT